MEPVHRGDTNDDVFVNDWNTSVTAVFYERNCDIGKRDDLPILA